jgi:Domain of unknown function (DUF4105)
MLMKRMFGFLLLFISGLNANAQIKNDSCSMQISMLTCAPGTELYSIFGHTAIRVRDSSRGMDIVYNYGTFDDTDPLFYIHFTNGIMNYSISAETMESFLTEYQFEHRNVLEQVLDLNCQEKNKLYEALRKNTLENNRIYQYHFHTDNCTTRAARIIESNTMDSFVYKNILPVNSSPGISGSGNGLSFRDMIHEYLDKQHKSWSEFGIDLFLGKNLDARVTNLDAIHFLPDYLYRGMDSAYDGKKLLVSRKNSIIKFPSAKDPTEGLTPVALFQCLLLANILLFIFRKPGLNRILLVFDIIFFTLLGLLGILMAYLWIARIDDVCRNNMNILWAVPTHLIMVFFIRKKAAWIKYYFLVTAIVAALLSIGFPFWGQRMNIAVLPLLILIIFRSFMIYLNRKYAEKFIIQGQAA